MILAVFLLAAMIATGAAAPAEDNDKVYNLHIILNIEINHSKSKNSLVPFLYKLYIQ